MHTGTAFDKNGAAGGPGGHPNKGGIKMPELPEVETLCRQLQAAIGGRKILATEVFDKKLGGAGDMAGRSVRCVRRWGKTIEILLHDGQSVLINLRMTGRLFWHEEDKRPPHTRWRMNFSDGHVDLVDPRRFATVRMVQTCNRPSKNDLLHDFDKQTFLTKQAGRKVTVKTLMMDANAIAGIGNIYACEILHRTGISPLRPSRDVCEREWKDIFRTGRRILKKGIEKRGTSISDWRDLYGKPGENQHELKVYGRKGKECPVCGGEIVRIKQGSRSTYYCPGCQK